jgi:hypothetical protein
MVCSNCALDLDPNATVCPRCGTTVVKDVPMAPNAQNPVLDQSVSTDSQVMTNPVQPGVVDITQPVPIVTPDMQGGVANSQQIPIPPNTQGVINSNQMVQNPNVQMQSAIPNPNAAPQPGVVDITQPVPTVNPNMQMNAPVNQQQAPAPDVNQMVSNMRVDSVMPPAGTMGKINLIRKKSFVGCVIPFTIIVDGTVLGKLKNNTTLSFDLSFGQHQVTLKSTGKGVDQVIALSQNQMICDIKISPKFGLITAVPKVTEVTYRNQ